MVKYKICLDPNLKKLMEERGFTFDNNNIYKPERQLMATDIDALIKESTSDEFIEKKINDVLGGDVELKE